MPLKPRSLVVHANTELPKKTSLVKERFGQLIPGLINGIPNRNGFIWALCGAPGTGKTNLLLSMFRQREFYRAKFHHVYLFTPEVSFSSVLDHPFAGHPNVRHELTTETLAALYQQLQATKASSIEESDSDSDNGFADDEEDAEDARPKKKQRKQTEYSCVIIDDFADSLKDPEIERMLKTMLVKSRHLNTSFIFTLQSWLLMPKQLRKLLFNLTTFKPQNKEEWESLCKEVIHLNKTDSQELYAMVFDEPFIHLDIDLKDDKLYRSFNPLSWAD
jgi:hypothetical protein